MPVRKKPYLVYWNNIPAPYMVERFNALADRTTFEFEAWFNDRTEPDRSWEVDERSWRFKYRYLPTTRLGKRTLHWPTPIFGRRPDVLVSLYAEPSYLTGWGLAKLRGAKTGFWVEVTFDRWIPRNLVKDSIKRWIFRRVDAIVTVGENGKDFARRYGAEAEKIHFAPHVIDVVHYQTLSQVRATDRDRLRQELGLCGTTFVYVGRFWWVKGVKFLIDAFEAVQRLSSEPVSLLLVGDGPDEAELRKACVERHLQHVVFSGFKQKSELPRYYALGDVFVFPTLGDTYGLAVDEAMACSLPVVSTISAGEIRDRVEEGVNGYIVPPENGAALADRMLQLAEDPTLRARMGFASAQRMKGRTPQRWAQDFERIVQSLCPGSS